MEEDHLVDGSMAGNGVVILNWMSGKQVVRILKLRVVGPGPMMCFYGD
jgi:hypothetical protein